MARPPILGARGSTAEPFRHDALRAHARHRARDRVPVGEVPMNDHACGVWPGLEISGPSIEAIARFQQFDMKEPALDERPGEEARPAADLANAIAAMHPEQF